MYLKNVLAIITLLLAISFMFTSWNSIHARIHVPLFPSSSKLSYSNTFIYMASREQHGYLFSTKEQLSCKEVVVGFS